MIDATLVRRTARRGLGLMSTAAALAACGGDIGEVTVKEAELADTSAMTWEEFQALVYQEPEAGVFIVDGDTPVVGEEALRRFYAEHVAGDQALAVSTSGGRDVRWSAAAQRDLRYCVSQSGFGARYSTVVSAMQAATRAWEAAADVRFVHVVAEDARCSASNAAVVFDVRPVNAGGSYLARAFFPDQARSTRNVLIDGTAFGGSPSLVGILTHELGHTLGFRHEHTRPEAGACFEDQAWRALTPYDSASVMHYPQCNGTARDLAMTVRDREGAAALYGAPGGTTPTPTPTPTPSGVRVATVQGSAARGQTRRYQPLDLQPGSTLEVRLSGTGDADLYVQLGAAPTTRSFACRSDGPTADEVCTLTVPASPTQAYLAVLGYSASTYTMTVVYTPRTP